MRDVEHVMYTCRTLGTLFMKVSSGYVVKGDDDTVLKPVKQLADFAADILGGRYAIIDRLPFRTRLYLQCTPVLTHSRTSVLPTALGTGDDTPQPRRALARPPLANRRPHRGPRPRRPRELPPPPSYSRLTTTRPHS